MNTNDEIQSLVNIATDCLFQAYSLWAESYGESGEVPSLKAISELKNDLRIADAMVDGLRTAIASREVLA